MITSRDFPLVCLNDGRPWGQINNKPTVATQVTILISNFLFDLDERFQPAARGHFPPLICLLSRAPASHSDKTSEQTADFLEVVLSGVVFEVCKETSDCLNEQLNVQMNRAERTAANAHITIHAWGLFWLMRLQYSSSNHFNSIVILF